MRKLTYGMSLSLDATPAHIEFAGRWRDMPKVVFSSKDIAVDWNAPVHRRRGHGDHQAQGRGRR